MYKFFFLHRCISRETVIAQCGSFFEHLESLKLLYAVFDTMQLFSFCPFCFAIVVFGIL